MTIPHYWNPQQVERLLNALAALGLRRARVAALIMWRAGLRVGETVALEWRDIDLTAGSLLVRRGKGGRGRTVPLHPDLASLFANWPTSYGPRDLVVGLTRRRPCGICVPASSMPTLTRSRPVPDARELGPIASVTVRPVTG